ncbi:MAG: hypothetical protein QF793_01810 [Candidatus Peribacteraceae bacterium]|jgi:hypothetical protein|nr:hypothetical protein [Candidatus Peribacteraceae bacterium]|tara:strand:+ start:19372 stop:20697 length:1326 start_codon:yes stop_codon:yes gene_type:complete
MLQTLRQRLTLVLLAALPLHALLVTVGTKVIAGPGNAPMTGLALWKEALLLVILGIAVVEMLSSFCRDAPWRVSTEVDVIDVLIISLVALSAILFFYQLPATSYQLLLGFKYDFIPLVALLVLRRVEWSKAFKYQLMNILIAVGGIIALYGIATLFAPQSFFSWLGYGDLHSLYRPTGPLAAFQQIGGTGIRRIQSTMSGPNQLGLWLLIPLSIALIRKKSVGVFIVFAMFLTLSRSALLAAGVMVAVVLWKQLPRKKFLQFVGALFCLSFVFSIVAYFFAADIVIRTASTSDHISRPLQAIRLIAERPLGYGLGTAGPASNRVSDTCVYLEEGDDPSWAQAHQDLCVFVGETQVQPEDRECSCPFLPENWYLQMGVEMGVLGLALFAMLVIVILRRLGKSPFVFLVFLGISIAALFLHAWEDSAVAYTVWVLLGLFIPPR